MSTQNACRITAADTNITLGEIMLRLSGNNPGALSVLKLWCQVDPMAFMAFLSCLDFKHLYDNRIWDVYKLCGEDINRFIYHVEMELPDQLTGQLGVGGPYASKVDLESFMAKRTFGKPGSFWALEHPPTEENYDYPIV